MPSGPVGARRGIGKLIDGGGRQKPLAAETGLDIELRRAVEGGKRRSRGQPRNRGHDEYRHRMPCLAARDTYALPLETDIGLTYAQHGVVGAETAEVGLDLCRRGGIPYPRARDVESHARGERHERKFMHRIEVLRTIPVQRLIHGHDVEHLAEGRVTAA